MVKIVLSIALSLLIFTSIFAQPDNDNPCDPNIVNSCTLVPGTTFGATLEPGFSPSGGCYNETDPGVFFELSTYGESFAQVEVVNMVGSNEVTFLFGKWSIDCETEFFQVYGEYCGSSDDATITIAGLSSIDGYTVFVSTPAGQPATFSLSVCTSSVLSCDENSLCSSAVSMGLVENTPVFGTSCNVGVDDNFDLGDCEHEGVVWFTFETPSSPNYSDLFINVSTVNGIVPIYRVYNGTCGSLNPLDNCQNGNQNGAYKLPVSANEQYFIGVSSFFVDCTIFDVSVATYTSGSSCVVSSGVYPTATSLGSPLSGPYQPCEDVSFCLDINEYTAVGNICQWLQGFIPIFGSAWAESSFDAERKPINIDVPLEPVYNATIEWYTDVTYNTPVTSKTVGDFDNDGVLEMCHVSETDCSNTGIVAGQIMPPGWYAWSIGDPNSTNGHPNVDWGDGSGCGGGQGPWQVCFTLQARCDNDCTENDCLDASVKLYSTSDGETGTWSGGISTCAADEPAIFNAQVIPSSMIVNDITFEEGDQYLKFSNNGSGYLFTTWNLPGEEIIKTPNNSDLFLLTTTNGINSVQVNTSDGFNVADLVTNAQVSFFVEDAEISLEQVEYCPSDVVKVNNTTNVVSALVDWTVEGGTIVEENEEYVEVVFDDAGTYSVDISIVDANGNIIEGSFPSFIEINEEPNSQFSHAFNSNILVLQNESSNYDHITWIVNSVPVAMDQELLNYEMPQNGFYQVTLEVTSDCGVSSITETIEFSGFPTVVVPSDYILVCPGDSALFSYTGSSNVDYGIWTFDQNVSDPIIGDSVWVTFEDAGLYEVLITGYNSVGIDQTSIQIEVSNESTAEFEYDINGAILELTNTSSNFDSLFWIVNDGEIIEENSFELTLVENEIISIDLIVFSSCASDTLSSDIVIDIFPDLNYNLDTIEICLGSTHVFILDSLSNVDSLEWIFPEPQAIIADSSIIEVSFDVEGFHPYSITGWNDLGEDYFNGIVHVINPPLPQAAFDYTIDGTSLSFSNTSAFYTSEIWIINNVDTFYSEDFEVVFDQNETIDIQLLVENNCYVDTLLSEVEINVFPIIEYEVDTINICLGSAYTFSLNELGNIDSVQWIFTNASPIESSEAEVDVLFLETGFFSYTLMGYNEYGVDSVVGTVNVIDGIPPISSFDYNISGTTLTTINTSLNYTDLLWIINGVDSIYSDNVELELIENGAIEITLVIENICSESVTTSEIMIDFFPNLLYDHDTITLCEGDFHSFNLNDLSNLDSINWNFDGGLPGTSFEQEVDVEYVNVGYFNYILIGFNEFGMDEFEGVVHVIPGDIPVADFDLQEDFADVVLYNEAVNYDSLIWLIDGEIFSTNVDSFSWSFNENGTYAISQIALNFCGNDTLSVTVQVVDIPVADFNSTTEVGCAPFQVIFNDVSTGADLERQWLFEGGEPETSIEQMVEVNYTVPGIYDVQLIVGNGFGTDTILMNEGIQINEAPAIDFTYDEGTGQFTSDITSGNVVLWDFGDGNQSNEENPIHFYDNSGIFEITLIAENTNCQDSLVMALDVIVNIDLYEANPSFVMVPNPVLKDKVQIRFSEPINPNTKWIIRDLNAKIIDQGLWKTSADIYSLDVPDDAGMYFLSLTNGQYSETQKFVVVR